MKTFHILIVLLAFISVSCSISSVEDFVVGENFIDDKSGILMIDTLTMKSSSFQYDSIISNSAGRILIGSNYNSFSGYKNSNAFLEMTFDDDILYTEFVFDSLCLVLNYDGYYSGDTTVTQKISVHQLQEEMELDDNSSLYTTSKFDYQTVPLGTLSFKPKPATKKEVSIRLSDQLGNRFAQLIKSKKDTLSSEALFKKLFNGLVIKSTPEVKGAIIGFSVTSATTSDSETTTTDTTASKPEMRLYYHLSPNPDNLSKLYYKFSMYSDGIYFNQISEETSGSQIANMAENNNDISSKLTGNQTLVQSGVQVFSKISIPYSDNLLLIGRNSAFISATLRLYPVKGSYKKSSDLPETLNVYSADKLNNITAQVTAPGTTDVVTANLKTISDVEEIVYYEIDISSFIDTELKEELETSRSLMIGYGSTEATKSVDRLIFGGPNSGIYSPKLNIYYYHN
ncbi:MAG: hypothetical protein WAO52_05550 [Prolixibacteraceae bacterium]